jgi:Fe-S cluster assembly ATP-binding protein
MSLLIKNLEISVSGKKIVSDINLEIKKGETHIIMGPNGSGKSTLANALLGHPRYIISGGKIILDDEDLTTKTPDVRAKAGLFLSAQSAPEINGVTVANLLRVAMQSVTQKPVNPFQFYDLLRKTMKKLKIDESFASRYVNTGFSGGEKKRAEILQLMILDPRFAILDETDAGLDVDALKIVGKGLSQFAKKDKGLLIITHQSRLLKYLKPDFVHIIVKGKIVKTAGNELIGEIEKNGYNQFV